MFRLRAARTSPVGANSFALGALNHRHAGYQSPRATEVAPTKNPVSPALALLFDTLGVSGS